MLAISLKPGLNSYCFSAHAGMLAIFLKPGSVVIVFFKVSHYLGYSFVSTVEPVYNGHPRDLRNWLLNTRLLKILIGCGLISILMAYHIKALHARKQ